MLQSPTHEKTTLSYLGNDRLLLWFTHFYTLHNILTHFKG